MTFGPLDKINEISGGLADVTTATEELRSERADGLDPAILERLLRALEDARVLVSLLEQQSEGGTDRPD